MSEYIKSKYPHKICEHCGYTVGMNSYIRNHSDKCPYKGAKPGYKFCRVCGKELLLQEFNKVSSSTYDGLNQACKECASVKKIICPHCNGIVITKYVNHRSIVIKGI